MKGGQASDELHSVIHMLVGEAPELGTADPQGFAADLTQCLVNECYSTMEWRQIPATPSSRIIVQRNVANQQHNCRSSDVSNKSGGRLATISGTQTMVCWSRRM